jgi:hypothetical protein
MEMNMATVAANRKSLYEEAPEEFVMPNRDDDPNAGGKTFKREKSAPGVVTYSTELTREDLRRNRPVNDKDKEDK